MQEAPNGAVAPKCPLSLGDIVLRTQRPVTLSTARHADQESAGKDSEGLCPSLSGASIHACPFPTLVNKRHDPIYWFQNPPNARRDLEIWLSVDSRRASAQALSSFSFSRQARGA